MPPCRMTKRFFIKVLAHLCAVFVVVAVVYAFRTDLVRFGGNRWLAEDEITITRLENLEVGFSRATVDILELRLRAGQRLVLSGIVLGYRVNSLTTVPVVESIAVASAELLPAINGTVATENGDEESSPLLISDLLQLLRELPLASVAINELSLPQRTEPLALTLQHTGGELNASITSGDLQFVTRFNQPDATATALLQVTLARGVETVGNFSVSLEPQQDSYALVGEGHLQFADLNALLGQLQQAPLPIPLKSASLDWELAGAVADDFSGTFKESPAAPATFVLGLKSGSAFTLPAQPDYNLGEVTATLKDRAEFTVITGADARISVGKLPLQSSGNWDMQPFTVDAVLSLTDCRPAACRVGFDGSATLETYSAAGNLNVDIVETADESSEYQLQTNNLVLGGLPTWSPPFDINARLVVTGDRLVFNTPLQLRNAPADAGITVDGSYDFALSELRAHINVPPVEFTEQGRALSAWLSGWPYAFDVLSGTLSTQATLEWRLGADATAATAATPDVLKATVELTANNLGGFYDDIFFRGLTSDLNGNIDTSSAFALEAPERSVTLDGIDVGVPIENIKLDFRFDRDARQLLVSSVSGEVLGGSIGGNDLRYEFGAASNDLKLVFSGLRLERMLELADYDGVQANGAVSGELPLTLTDTGIVVTGGSLRGDAPGGNIRYGAGVTGSAGNPGIDLVNKALANYQFDSLISTIEYSLEGELVLGMQMQGTNPDMSKDQRVNLNLNLTDNIPDLLKSLQAARDIEGFLQGQYQ